MRSNFVLFCCLMIANHAFFATNSASVSLTSSSNAHHVQYSQYPQINDTHTDDRLWNTSALRSSSDSFDAALPAFQSHGKNTPTILTIVVEPRGEMANIMWYLANGYALMWILQDEHNILSNVIVKASTPRNAIAWKSMRLCYPNLQKIHTVESDSIEFDIRQSQQDSWLGVNSSELFPSRQALNMDPILKRLAKILVNTARPPPGLPVDANITLPFIVTKSFAGTKVIDRFYDRVKKLFEYDVSNPACCGPIAHPEEHVFHARGFVVEMGKGSAAQHNMLDISPNKTVKELLKNHQRDDKFAVLSRYPSFGQLYVDRMRSEGLDARFVETVNGEHSFCYLMSGKNEIVGTVKSTFMLWASYLGNASKARLYVLRTPKLAAKTGGVESQIYNYTHPTLKGKIVGEVYNSEAQDLVEKRLKQKLKQRNI